MIYIFFKKNIFKKYLLNILNLISGCSIGYLYKNVDYKLPKNYKLDKGWIGRFLEFYINSYFSKNYCDIPILNLEIKTFSSNYLGFPNQDIFLMSLKLTNFFKIINKKNIFFYKIKNILWIPILGDKNIYFLYKLIGNFFISFFNKKDFDLFFIELSEIFNFIFNNDIFLPNYYTYTFRFQLLLVNNKNKKINFIFDKYILRIYFRKNYLKKILLKNNLFR